MNKQLGFLSEGEYIYWMLGFITNDGIIDVSREEGGLWQATH